MSAQTSPVTAVVINGRPELQQAIAEIAEKAGFRTVKASPAEAGGTTAAIQEFLRSNDARVVVYDVDAPLREHWAVLQALRYAEMISGSWRQFVVTTADRAALAAAGGANAAIQTAGGLDTAALAQALQRAILV